MKKLVLYLFALSLYSCAIKGNFEGLYSYYKKAKRNRPNLFIENASQIDICVLQNKEIPKVIITNGRLLKQCVENCEDAVVYVWAPKCKGNHCIPLNVAQAYCTKKNKALFIVAEYYDVALMDQNYAINKPIFGIDIKYYHSGLTSKYLKLFLDDLTSRENVTARFLLFHQGTLINTFDDVSQI